MITLRKLQSLKTSTRMRKEALLLRQLENALAAGNAPDGIYLKGLCRICCEDLNIPFLYPTEPEKLLFYCNSLRHLLLKNLGQEPADWDFTNPGDRSEKRNILPLKIYLDDVRSPFNVGSLFRSAEAFGVEKVFLSPGTASPEHPRALRTSMGAAEILPWQICGIDKLEGPLFALETGGVSLGDFPFPEKGVLVIGSEELGVRPEILTRCDQEGGRVSIDLSGSKGSLNLSVAFGIVIQAWNSSVQQD